MGGKIMRKGVQKIYTEVAETYESINHVLTLGLDILWRKKALRTVTPAQAQYWLDVCSGTGEMTYNLSRMADASTTIFSVDFSFPMLSRAIKKTYKTTVHFTIADVAHLPFPDATFDLVTISFSIRNLNLNRDELLAHLGEFYRILKPGGQFINLETSQPSSRHLRKIFHFYIRKIVKPVGSFLSGSKAGYGYLAYTVPRFYPPEEFSSLILEAGFSKVKFHSTFLSFAAIHLATK
jgi:demethylmenaquinone methyltransferase/2-methoxy-6-polyprenyl-1,4-benzoquinol methylase